MDLKFSKKLDDRIMYLIYLCMNIFPVNVNIGVQSAIQITIPMEIEQVKRNLA